jgi:ABC-type sugar transport system ATPase subunit
VTRQGVRLEGVTKTYRTARGVVPALHRVDLTVEPGELFVLLGPSGCGKTTLLDLVAGLEDPTAGRISIGDIVVADAERRVFRMPFERNVAMVFQSYALYPHMSVAGNLAFPLTNEKPRRPADEIRRRVVEVATLLQIESLLERKPAELSGGQRQRVAIGRAIAREPAVFLMDEPLSNLDARLRLETRSQIKELQRRLGVTSLYVTHDQTEAMTLGDRIAVLDHGQVQQVGTPLEIYDHPINPFVARFVGSPPMNLLEGDLERSDEGLVLHAGPLKIRLREPLPPRVQERAGSHCVLGIRPEHLVLVPAGTGDCDVEIGLREDLGAETLHYVFLPDGALVVRASQGWNASRGGLVFPPEHVHVFPPSVDRG